MRMRLPARASRILLSLPDDLPAGVAGYRLSRSGRGRRRARDD